MNIRRAAETKATSLVLMKQNGSSEEIESKLIDFHWQIAQIVERHEEQKRERLLELMRNLSPDDEQWLLLKMIVDRMKLSPIYPKLLNEIGRAHV